MCKRKEKVKGALTSDSGGRGLGCAERVSAGIRAVPDLVAGVDAQLVVGQLRQFVHLVAVTRAVEDRVETVTDTHRWSFHDHTHTYIIFTQGHSMITPTLISSLLPPGNLSYSTL